MKAPFKGAQVAYGKQRTFRRFGVRDFIGFSEEAILTAEAPNELVNRLIVYPVIEARMEAFIRASHRGKVHPGGPGTIEEIMTMLALLCMPENKDVPFAFDMVEMQGGVYFKNSSNILPRVSATNWMDTTSSLPAIRETTPTMLRKARAIYPCVTFGTTPLSLTRVCRSRLK